MKKYNVVLMGSRPLGERVYWLLKNNPKINLIGIVTLPIGSKSWCNEYLAKMAKDNNTKLLTEEQILDYEIDLILSINYWKKINEPLLSHPKKGIVNIHHSYNLRQRGRNPGTWAILESKVKKFSFHGTTLHFIDGELDKGKVIETTAFEITELDTAKTLYTKADGLAYELINKNLMKILENDYIETSEPEQNPSYHSSELNKEINLRYTKEQLWDFVRALQFEPFEPAFINTNSGKIYLSIRSV